MNFISVWHFCNRKISIRTFLPHTFWHRSCKSTDEFQSAYLNRIWIIISVIIIWNRWCWHISTRPAHIFCHIPHTSWHSCWIPFRALHFACILRALYTCTLTERLYCNNDTTDIYVPYLKLLESFSSRFYSLYYSMFLVDSQHLVGWVSKGNKKKVHMCERHQ